MHVVVAGGGAVGAQLAQALRAAGNEVVVVESEAGRAGVLAAQGLHVVTGNACVATTLETAGALRADVLVACTGSDEENLVISVLAKRHLEVPRVVARVNDDANRWLFEDSWGVDAAVSQASALVALIEEATGSGRTVRLAELGAVGLVLVGVNVTAGSAAIGQSPAELGLSERDLVAAVVRRGRPMPVDDALRFGVGDRVLVLTDPAGEGRVHVAFYPDGAAAPAGLSSHGEALS
ncbi:MAG: NAD-binding protein [Actinomycetota bacterium]|jgi:trk system potassium uptake protein TrkA|nr:NAD-binding protein [Actinomycetota bacterium]